MSSSERITNNENKKVIYEKTYLTEQTTVTFFYTAVFFNLFEYATLIKLRR
jgi:hypothetical protein